MASGFGITDLYPAGRRYFPSRPGLLRDRTTLGLGKCELGPMPGSERVGVSGNRVPSATTSLDRPLFKRPLPAVQMEELDELVSSLHSKEPEVEGEFHSDILPATSSGTIYSPAVLVITSLRSWTSDIRGMTISISQW